MDEEKILHEYRTVAVVGLSADPKRPRHKVAAYLADHGYEIIPVNPDAREILGLPSYPDLKLVPRAVEVVDIFRRAEEVLPIVEEAIKIGAKAVWMQEGGYKRGSGSKGSGCGTPGCHE